MEWKASCWSLSFLSSDYVMIVCAMVFFDLVGLAEERTKQAFFERINNKQVPKNRNQCPSEQTRRSNTPALGRSCLLG